MTPYQELMMAVSQYYGVGTDQWLEIQKHGISAPHLEEILSNIPGVSIVKNADGSIRSFNLSATENITSSAETAVNSNVPATLQTFDVPATTGIQEITNSAGETVKQVTFKSGMSKAGKFVFGEVAPAVAAASVGITLGKTVDKLLYNANPDFWDEHGMSTLNPDEWNNITSNDTAGGRLFNMVFGLNPEGKTQAYIDQNALAYMALYAKNKGVFSKETNEYSPDDYIKVTSPKYANAKVYATVGDTYALTPNGTVNNLLVSENESEVYKGFSTLSKEEAQANFASLKPFKFTNNVNSYKYFNATEITNSNGIKYYCSLEAILPYDKDKIISPEISYIPDDTSYNFGPRTWAYIVLFGSQKIIGGIEGIGTQDNAKTPDLSNAETVEDTLQALKTQYPQLFENAVTQDVVQPDGTIKTYTYVPVATPDIDQDGNPISSTSDQAKPEVDPETATENLLKTIAQIIQKVPPTNPPDIGKGDTPVAVPPTGSASALYAIYNPTLAQINAFGAWLWSDNFIEQIKKLFNDPMQAIIGLHKVYATPAVSGAQNIKVGYLDSGVSANVVSNQYTTIDCGTVSLPEYFRNVFDYSPYTEVNLYLPFIGIVPLDNADVMRSSIHIIYHVDVLSGACLAEVKVIRDGAGGTLYQYTGNASVTLPISSGSYMGIVSSIASIAGGIAGTIASGGSALPMITSAVGSALNARTKVEHSGSFSGNAGAMGGKIPYLIISRPQIALANEYQKYIGYPANFSTTLGSCSGFTKAVECHLENVNATDSELDEIDALLKEGVIV